MKNIRNYTIKEFAEFASAELNDITNSELLILKGHIIVEYTINCYLESISNGTTSDFFDEQFSFSQKVKLIKYFSEIGDLSESLNKELILLNKLRNDIAHSLSYNPKTMTELFNELEKKDKAGYFKDPSKTIQTKFGGAIAFITGAIFSAYRINIDPNEIDEYIEKK